MGAASPGLGHPHRRTHAELSCFVRRCGDNPARSEPADDDWLPTKRRLVTLFHGGEERVEVEVEHARLVPHGHILATERTSPLARRREPAPVAGRTAARSPDTNLSTGTGSAYLSTGLARLRPACGRRCHPRSHERIEHRRPDPAYAGGCPGKGALPRGVPSVGEPCRPRVRTRSPDPVHDQGRPSGGGTAIGIA